MIDISKPIRKTHPLFDFLLFSILGLITSCLLIGWVPTCFMGMILAWVHSSHEKEKASEERNRMLIEAVNRICDEIQKNRE